MILTDALIEAQYEGFKVVGFKYDHNRYSEGFSGVIEIEFPNATHEDFDNYKCDNFIAYDDDCKRIAFDNWYPEEVYYNLCMYIRKHIMNN
jgi:hypothetical protein